MCLSSTVSHASSCWAAMPVPGWACGGAGPGDTAEPQSSTLCLHVPLHFKEKCNLSGISPVPASSPSSTPRMGSETTPTTPRMTAAKMPVSSRRASLPLRGPASIRASGAGMRWSSKRTRCRRSCASAQCRSYLQHAATSSGAGRFPLWQVQAKHQGQAPRRKPGVSPTICSQQACHCHLRGAHQPHAARVSLASCHPKAAPTTFPWWPSLSLLTCPAPAPQ